MDSVKSLTQLSIRQLLLQGLNMVLIVASALAIWRGMAIFTNCESPIVVVLSESMEPAFARGDLLLLTWWSDPVRVNDIVVFKIDDRPIPIVHRCSKVHEDVSNNRAYYLTKGDNNNVDDRGLYAPGQNWIQRKHIMGRVLAHVPYIGMVTIIFNDYPMAKYALLGMLGLVTLVTRE